MKRLFLIWGIAFVIISLVGLGYADVLKNHPVIQWICLIIGCGLNGVFIGFGAIHLCDLIKNNRD